MLRMKSMFVADGKPIVADRVTTSGGGRWGSLNVSAIYLSGKNLHIHTDEFRAPDDYLVQGGAFDNFYNKYVDNDQLLGTLNTTPDFGYGVPDLSSVRVTSEWTRWYSRPPVARVAPNVEGAIINLAPLCFAAAGHDDRVHTTMVVCYDWTVYNGPPFVCGTRIDTSAIINNDTGKITFNISHARCGSWYYYWNQASFISSEVSRILAEARAWAQGRKWDGSVAHIATRLYRIVLEVRKSYRKAYQQWVASRTSVRESGKGYTIRNFTHSMPEESDIVRYRKFLSELRSNFSFTDFELSRHARDVIDDLNNFDSNLIAYSADLKKTGDTARSILNLARNAKSPKAWASAWLSGRYGDRLAFSDTKELLESINKRLTTRANYALARKTIEKSQSDDLFELSLSRTSTVVASNESYDLLMTAVYDAMKWDLWPTLENSWDLVPVSFVADWFAPIQDLCGQIDAAIEKPYIKPLTQYIGEVLEIRFPLAKPELTGVLELRHYRRRPYDVLSDVRPFDVTIAPPSFSVVHGIDGLALLVQTSKRA